MEKEAYIRQLDVETGSLNILVSSFWNKTV